MANIHALCDDTLRELYERLARLPADVEGIKWQKNRFSKSRDALALASTCTHMFTVLWACHDGIAQELRARAQNDVQPLVRDIPYPYMHHQERVRHAHARVRVLRKCETAMAFHCAGKHCRAARKDVRRALKIRHDVVHPVKETSVALFSSASKAPVAFCVVAHRALNPPMSHIAVVDARSTGVELQLTMRLHDATTAYFSDPLYIAAEPYGRACAFIRETCEGATDLRVAVTTELRHGAYTTDEKCIVVPTPASHPSMGMILLKAQAIWWSEQTWPGGQPHTYLNVGWSTVFVHPAGHCGETGGVVNEHERYMFCKYEFDGFRFYDLETRGAWPWTLPQSGRLLTVSATADGTRVAALVRRLPAEKWQTHYYVALHNCSLDYSSTARTSVRHPSIWKCKGKRRAGNDGFDWGPSAVAMSPTGDSITVLHRTSGSVIAEVLDLDYDIYTSLTTYTSSNSRDITEWLSRSDFYAVMEYVDPPSSSSDEDEFPNKVKLPYAIAYSDCGSHVHITDRRPLHGCKAPGYSIVLLDLSKRRVDKVLRAVPLFHDRQSHIKAMEWREHTLWVQGRRGVVRVTSA